MEVKNFETKEQLIKFCKDNKSILLAEKKASLKCADSISYMISATNDKGKIIKADSLTEIKDLSSIDVELVINTTNILDSHFDVHIPNLWKKSLSETKLLYLLQEHQMKFDKIITDEIEAFTKNISWEKLGYSYEGNTQALIFKAKISKERNEFMFNQYLKGYVKNHSVGMRYVKMDMCIDSNEKYYIDEKENWDKYINEIVNKDKAIERGMFWVVTEAKIIEGSAVPIGSNQATPTLSVTQSKNIEAVEDTSKIEPSNDTQNVNRRIF